MRILSWDVGIINLAFCLIDYNQETKKWTIADWNIINLTNRHLIKCHCGKNPSFYQNINDKKKYYCKVHSKKINIIPPNFEELFELNKDKSILCSYTNKNNICHKPKKFKFQEKCYCNSHAKSKYKKISSQYKLNDVKKKSVASISIDELRIKLVKSLEEKPNLLSANLVLVENQPTLKNPKMKAISSTIYDYYLIRGIFDRKRSFNCDECRKRSFNCDECRKRSFNCDECKKCINSNIEFVKYMSPSNKLKIANDGDTQKLIKLKGDDAKTYKMTKSLAIKYCSQMIEPFEQWKEFFNQQKKKDDLADCFLQGIYYINKNI